MRCIISDILTASLLLKLNVRSFSYLLFLALILVSCSSTKETREIKIEQYRVDIEKFSPLDTYFDSLNIQSEVQKPQVWFTYDKSSPIPKTRFIQKDTKIFKIQVQISDDFNSLKETRNKISQLYPEKVISISFDQPFYKLRIGNFKSRNEATQFIKLLESNGYIGCRIIEESIQ